MKLKKGIKLLEEEEGSGEPVRRQHNYVLRIQLQLNRGEIIQNSRHCLSHSVDDHFQEFGDGSFQFRTRIDRECLIAGVFYTLDGMSIGGRRKVLISPHLAYGDRGIPGIIPAAAVITADIRVVSKVQ